MIYIYLQYVNQEFSSKKILWDGNGKLVLEYRKCKTRHVAGYFEETKVWRAIQFPVSKHSVASPA